jgi:hypothetical protein
VDGVQNNCSALPWLWYFSLLLSIGGIVFTSCKFFNAVTSSTSTVNTLARLCRRLGVFVITALMQSSSPRFWPSEQSYRDRHRRQRELDDICFVFTRPQCVPHRVCCSFRPRLLAMPSRATLYVIASSLAHLYVSSGVHNSTKYCMSAFALLYLALVCLDPLSLDDVFRIQLCLFNALAAPFVGVAESVTALSHALPSHDDMDVDGSES